MTGWRTLEATGAKHFTVRGYFGTGEFHSEAVRADDARQAKRKLEERYRALHLEFRAASAHLLKIPAKR